MEKMNEPPVEERLREALDPASVVERAIEKLRSLHVRVGGTWANTRAHMIGFPCERRLVYERTEEDREAHDSALQAIFDVGNMIERQAIRDLEDAGFEIVSRGVDMRDARYELSGKIDAEIRWPTWERALLTEIKSVNPYTWETLGTLADVRDSKYAFVRRWYDQLQVYLFLRSQGSGLLVLVNKSTGRWRILNAPLDLDRAEALIQRAERVRDHVAQGSLPERVESAENCDRCPFRLVCLPDRSFGPGLDLVDSAEVEALLDRRALLKPMADEFKHVDEELKEKLPEKDGEILAGRWLVRAKWQERKGYSVEAGKSLRRTYLPVGTTSKH